MCAHMMTSGLRLDQVTTLRDGPRSPPNQWIRSAAPRPAGPAPGRAETDERDAAHARWLRPARPRSPSRPRAARGSRSWSAAARSSPTRATPATTLGVPRCSSTLVSPRASSPGRTVASPSSHADSTTCSGVRAVGRVRARTSGRRPAAATRTAGSRSGASRARRRGRRCRAPSRRPRSRDPAAAPMGRRAGPRCATPAPRASARGQVRSGDRDDLAPSAAPGPLAADSQAVADGATTTGTPRNDGSVPHGSCPSTPVETTTSALDRRSAAARAAPVQFGQRIARTSRGRRRRSAPGSRGWASTSRSARTRRTRSATAAAGAERRAGGLVRRRRPPRACRRRPGRTSTIAASAAPAPDGSRPAAPARGTEPATGKRPAPGGDRPLELAPSAQQRRRRGADPAHRLQRLDRLPQFDEQLGRLRVARRAHRRQPAGHRARPARPRRTPPPGGARRSAIATPEFGQPAPVDRRRGLQVDAAEARLVRGEFGEPGPHRCGPRRASSPCAAASRAWTYRACSRAVIGSRATRRVPARRAHRVAAAAVTGFDRYASAAISAAVRAGSCAPSRGQLCAQPQRPAARAATRDGRRPGPPAAATSSALRRQLSLPRRRNRSRARAANRRAAATSPIDQRAPGPLQLGLGEVLGEPVPPEDLGRARPARRPPRGSARPRPAPAPGRAAQTPRESCRRSELRRPRP